MNSVAHVEFFAIREQFYKLEESTTFRHEFSCGRVTTKPGEGLIHGRIISSVVGVLGTSLLNTPHFAVPCLQMVRIETEDMDVYPDVVVYCEGAAFDARFSRTLIEPLVLVEVLSPSTQSVDQTTKLGAYFTIPTLTDYLIIWQDRVRLDQFVRSVQPDNVPILRRHRSRDSRVRLESLDIEFTLGELYRCLDDLPEGP